MKRAASQIVTLGLLQTDCSADPDANLKKTIALIERAAKPGAQIICTQELFRSQYFCQSEDHENLNWPKKFPARAPTPSASSRRSTRSSSSPRCSRNAPPAFITTPPRSLTPTVRCWACIARCTSRTTRFFTRNFISRPATSASRPGNTRYGKIGVLICWDQWYPEAARLTAMQGAEILFYPTAIGWHPGEKKEYGERQHNAWETIQRCHAIANGCYVAVRQPHRPRSHQGRGRRRHRILGPKFRRRNLRRNSGESLGEQGGDFDRARGSRQSGRDAHALAVFARPPD